MNEMLALSAAVYDQFAGAKLGANLGKVIVPDAGWSRGDAVVTIARLLEMGD